MNIVLRRWTWKSFKRERLTRSTTINLKIPIRGGISRTCWPVAMFFCAAARSPPGKSQLSFSSVLYPSPPYSLSLLSCFVDCFAGENPQLWMILDTWMISVIAYSVHVVRTLKWATQSYRINFVSSNSNGGQKSDDTHQDEEWEGFVESFFLVAKDILTCCNSYKGKFCRKSYIFIHRSWLQWFL